MPLAVLITALLSVMATTHLSSVQPKARLHAAAIAAAIVGLALDGGGAVADADTNARNVGNMIGLGACRSRQQYPL